MQGDKIMTAAVHNGIPMFFSRLNGLVCITAADFEQNDFFNGYVNFSISRETLFSTTDSKSILLRNGLLQMTSKALGVIHKRRHGKGPSKRDIPKKFWPILTLSS